MTEPPEEPNTGDPPGQNPPPEPDLPEYVLEPLRRAGPERLRTIARYATELAVHKEGNAAFERYVRRTLSDRHREDLNDAGKETDPREYDGVPTDGRAYLTVKEPRDGDAYYYWAWREGDGWRSKLVCRVDAVYADPDDRPRRGDVTAEPSGWAETADWDS